MTLLFLIACVLVAVVALAKLRRRDRFGADPVPPRVEPQPFGRQPEPFGRQPEPWGRGYPQQPVGPGVPPAGSGLGSSIAGGLAAGLAMGAGAVAAQEIGRRMFEHGPDAHPSPDGHPAAHAPASDSQLARDAGIGAFDRSPDRLLGGEDVGPGPEAGWDDGGGFDDAGGFDGGDGGWEA